MRQTRSRRKRGLILIVTLFFMILFAFMGVALYQITPSEIKGAVRDLNVTEAHFACTSGIRFTRTWMSAVSAPGRDDPNGPNALGDDWGSLGGTVSVGNWSYVRTSSDPFSVPTTDKNFNQTTLGALRCPYNKIDTSSDGGLQLLGLQAGANLSPADYAAMKGDQANWMALRQVKPLVVGDYEVYSFVIPAKDTMSVLRGYTANGARAYLVTSIAYKSGIPVMRARSLLKEQSAATYAWLTAKPGVDAAGNPLMLMVSKATDNLFDGPVHTNGVFYFQVASAYWNAALVNGTRAIQGTLTFAGSNNAITPNFDGIAWQGGNYEGSSNDRRPHDDNGIPIASSAGGAVVNRYDRFITGGLSAIRKVGQVALPQDITELKNGAFGKQEVTGLNVSLNQVDTIQKAGSLQQEKVYRPGWRNSGGGVVSPTNMTNSSDNGIFINTRQGTREAAAGIVFKGDTQTTILEATDAYGRPVTDVSALESGNYTTRDADGKEHYSLNPTIRAQSTQVAYDSQITRNEIDYAANGTTGASNYWSSTVPSNPPPANYTGNTTSYQSGFEHSGPACPQRTVTWGSGVAGVGAPTYSCIHPRTITQYQYTSPGSTRYSPVGNVSVPQEFYPQDWAVEVKNTSHTIPTAFDTSNLATLGPSSAQNTAYERAWRAGVGTEAYVNSPNYNYLSQAHDLKVNEVYLHEGTSGTETLLTSPRSITVSENKIVLYKQSRSNMKRLDVFLLDRRRDEHGNVAPLTGAVYGTGDVGSLRGVNLERRTIGADYAADKGISIVDNVWQYGTARGSKPTSANHGLGLLASKMNVQTASSYFRNKTLKIYAFLIAGKNQANNTGGLDVSETDSSIGTYFYRYANSTDTYARDRMLQIFGGLTEQQSKARLEGDRGWNQGVLFDKELSNNPPPYFPTTNVYAPMSYSQEVIRL